MIVCDGKHDGEQVKGLGSLVVQSKVELGGEPAQVQIRIQIPGKHYCKNCFQEKAKDINPCEIIKNAKEKRGGDPRNA